MLSARASALAAPCVIVVLFATCLWGSGRLAFRDVSHFYTPLYDYVAERQAEAWIPLWNPLDHSGIPLAGETTTAVFYPLRWLIYSLPIGGGAAMTWYIVLHLIIASFAAYRCARWSGVSPEASGLASVAYSLSGSVFFLYCNPPFLVSAAWLPLALGALVCRGGPMGRHRLTIGSVALAMMILGGDPQTALHTMLAAFAVWMLRHFRTAPNPIDLRALVLVPSIAAVLAMPQIAAALDWSRQSDRVVAEDNSFWKPPLIGSRKAESFQFSLAPWHAVEVGTPAAFGTLFPVNRRLSRLMPGDGRMWTPSIYMGGLIAICFISRVRSWRTGGVDAWTGISALSLLLAMGHFGMVWWLQNMTGLLDSVDSAVGGPYWFLYQLLPGYSAFRYPAKWLTLFALGMSIATAKWMDDERRWNGVARLAAGVAVVFAFASIALWIARFSMTLVGEPSLPLASRDEFWGPLQLTSGLTQAGISCAQTTVVAALIASLLTVGRKRGISRTRILVLLMMLLVVDVGIAARTNLQIVSHTRVAALANQSDPFADDQSDAFSLMRTQTGGGWPTTWIDTSDMKRPTEVETSQRTNRFGRWHLSYGQRMFNSVTSIRSQADLGFWETTGEILNGSPADRRVMQWNALQRWLGIDTVLQSTSRSNQVTFEETEFILVDQSAVPVQEPAPPIQVHFDWRVVGTTADLDDGFKNRLREIVSDIGDQQPLVEVPDPQSNWPARDVSPATSRVAQPGAAPRRESNPPASKITRVEDGSDQCVVTVQSDQTCLVTRTTYQDGHWVARYRKNGESSWIRAKVLRVDRLHQGIILPAGEWEIEWMYGPWWLTLCVSLAVLAWFALAAITFQYRSG